MDSLKFEGSLDSGIKFQIRTMASFSGMEEIALIIEGKPVTIINVSKKKNGGIEIRPVMNVKMRLPGQTSPTKIQPLEEQMPVQPRLLDDVT